MWMVVERQAAAESIEGPTIDGKAGVTRHLETAVRVCRQVRDTLRLFIIVPDKARDSD